MRSHYPVSAVMSQAILKHSVSEFMNLICYAPHLVKVRGLGDGAGQWPIC